ncbi:hypothetical protein BDF19DRAFT_434363 [Syncephalis fuscata]|nr:hypothetical protein BDF19DRAFT_434363 [Syncephalis fuscata]
MDSTDYSNDNNWFLALLHECQHLLDHYYNISINHDYDLFTWPLLMIMGLGFISSILWLRVSRSRPVRWTKEQVDASSSLIEYVDRLADSGRANQPILSPNLLNENIEVKLNDRNEQFIVKRAREYSWLKRVYYILYDRGWRGLFPGYRRTLSLPDEDDYQNTLNKATAPWSVYLYLSKDDDMLEDETTVSRAFNRYLHQLPMNCKSPTSSFKLALYFTRMCGYLISQKVPLLPFGINWEEPQLVKLLCDMGQLLPADQYVVQVDMARPVAINTLTLRVKIDFPVRKAIEKARLQYDQAKVNTLKRLKKAKKRAFEVWGSLDDGFESFSINDEDRDLKQLLVEEEQVQRYRNNRNITVACIDYLKTIPHMTIQEALTDARIVVINAFAKRVQVKKDKDNCTTVLRRLLLAIKLGLTTSTLDLNPGFESFATKNHLHRYLFVQRHELSTNESGTIIILRDGVPRLWPEIRDGISVDPQTGVMQGQYNYQGLIDRGVYEWEALTPFYIEPVCPPPWGDRYLFEFCSWIVDRPRMMGDHTYMRLKTPQGEWYSVGQYRPQKMGFHEQFVFPMKIKTSKFMSPDVSEYWNGPFTALSVEITQEQFEQMKMKIEHDQMNGDHTYQLFHGNCTKYVKSISTIAGLNLPSSIPILEILLSSQKLKSTGRKALNWKYLPKWIKPFLKRCWALTFNLFGLVFGSGMIDNELKNEPKFRGIRPFIGDVYDLTNPDKTIADHPFIVGHYVIKVVEKWRSERTLELTAELQALQKTLTKLENNSRVTRSKTSRKTQLTVLNARIAKIEQQLDGIPYAVPDRFLQSPQPLPSEDKELGESDNSNEYLDDPHDRIWQEVQ